MKRFEGSKDIEKLMSRKIGVCYEETGPVYYYETRAKFPHRREVVVTSRGERRIGRVVAVDAPVGNEAIDDPYALISLLGDKDRMQREKNQMDAKEAKKVAREMVVKHGLEMKLTHVAYVFDRSKLIFYFTADARVDFRELVKELAAMFRTRIELRQIGVRDEAKLLGGLGPCGRPLCCSTFLGDFVPVSIKMAKDQGLSLNPIKISGICGRLMCCLQYEQEEYERAGLEMPDWGERVETPDGLGQVVGVNLLSRVVRVKLNDREMYTEYLASEIKGRRPKHSH